MSLSNYPQRQRLIRSRANLEAKRLFCCWLYLASLNLYENSTRLFKSNFSSSRTKDRLLRWLWPECSHDPIFRGLWCPSTLTWRYCLAIYFIHTNYIHHVSFSTNRVCGTKCDNSPMDTFLWDTFRWLWWLSSAINKRSFAKNKASANKQRWMGKFVQLHLAFDRSRQTTTTIVMTARIMFDLSVCLLSHVISMY